MPVHGKLTDAAGVKILNMLLGGTPAQFPTVWYVGYAMGDASPANVGAEPSGNGYARESVPATLANFSPPTAQVVNNVADIEWPAASGNQGTIKTIVLYDSPNGGNAWWYAPLQSSKEMVTGDAMRIPPGGLVFEFLAGGLSNYTKNRLLGTMFNGASYPIPSTYWMGYSTTNHSDAAAGLEPSGGSYARVSIGNSTAQWPPSATPSKTNAVGVQFPELVGPSAHSAVGLGIYDSNTGGNLIAFADLAPIPLAATMSPYISPNTIELTFLEP